MYIKNSAVGWIEPVAVRSLLTQTAEMYERGANHPATLIFAGVWFEADHMNQTVYDSYGFDALLGSNYYPYIGTATLTGTTQKSL